MNTWHFPITLAHLLEERGISQRQLAKQMGVSPSNITQIMDGQRCSPEVLALFCKEAAETMAERYSLICAHLRDEVVRAECDPTYVVIRHVEGADLNQLDLTPEMNAYIGTVARASESDEDVAGLIEGLAGLLVHKQAAEADLARLIQFPAGQEARAEPLTAESVVDAETGRRSQAKRSKKSS